MSRLERLETVSRIVYAVHETYKVYKIYQAYRLLSTSGNHRRTAKRNYHRILKKYANLQNLSDYIRTEYENANIQLAGRHPHQRFDTIKHELPLNIDSDGNVQFRSLSSSSQQQQQQQTHQQQLQHQQQQQQQQPLQQQQHHAHIRIMNFPGRIIHIPSCIPPAIFEFFARGVPKLNIYSQDTFCHMIRMDVNSFSVLLQIIRSRLERNTIRKSIAPEKRLAFTLIYLANEFTFQQLADAFDIGLCTSRTIVYDTCAVISEELSPKYLAPPTSNEWGRIADEFYHRIQLPNCLGVLDAKRVDFHCKHDFSVVLLAACSAGYHFTLAEIVVPDNNGQLPNSSFATSSIGRQILSGILDCPLEKTLPKSTVTFPYYFVGYSALPLRSNLMKSYSAGCRPMSGEEEHFNMLFAKAQSVLDNALGILTNAWRILTTTAKCSFENVDKIILTTMTLHNFLMSQKDRYYFRDELIDRCRDGMLLSGAWRMNTAQLQSANEKQWICYEEKNVLDLRDTLSDYLSNSTIQILNNFSTEI